MSNIFNILITGVGGQGIVLIGDILREYGLSAPSIQNVVGTETRGVSQREGSVISTVRYLIEPKTYTFGDNYEFDELISPLIPTNDAHLVIGLEPLETIRNIRYVSEQTVVVLNTNNLFPKSVLVESKEQKLKSKYPSNADVLDLLNQFARKVIAVNFNKLTSAKFNSAKYANVIALGVAVRGFKDFLDPEGVKRIIKEMFQDSQNNVKAFEVGYNLVSLEQ